ncbi:MvaI/BcnI restriction endonuclease family protein [Spirulina subsalsa FACHB-351]|uniref:MvaI/BcnI restriction endonuclease family protein n=1 Tax=Spirulina subsalsa FACHB-351 TaxID=234711 RepID=A0ABT3L7F4_9CYAN|nr:MvaI/BcnI restriction endonuclease family protein [Spirulina subsalsa FACHB-351]
MKANGLTTPLTRLLDRMAAHGAIRFYAKRLAPNDNSKNQVYLGGGFGALNIIPHDEVESDDSNRAGSVRDRAKAMVRFFWLDDEGVSPAPDAQLILYPKYPEVRMSGFLRGAERAPNVLMRSRDEGRVLFFGICPDGRVLGHVVASDDPVARAFDAAAPGCDAIGVFLDLEKLRQGGTDPKEALLAALRRIHARGWIASQKMGRAGVPEPYSARNGGGYTLEAELGISPNGYADPDFMGWEVKQYGVSDFTSYRAKSPVTLMTPEPTGGLYRDEGVAAFLHRYGYPDKSGKADRINFGGVYAANRSFHPETGLMLRLAGFDATTGKITDLDGGIVLLDQNDNIAASWGFRGIIAHWNRKHAKAVYVPSLMQFPPPEYRYGAVVQLCEGTDVLLLLAAVSAGSVYYDPGIKIEAAGTANPVIKRRSQFRVHHNMLMSLYKNTGIFRLCDLQG